MAQQVEGFTGAQPIEDLFTSPDFGQVYVDWQASKKAASESERQLADRLASSYADDPSVSKHEIDDNVDYALGMSDESFEYIYAYDDTALGLRQHRNATANERDEAKTRLVEFSRDYGVSRFATYGLSLHLDHLARPELLASVVEAEQDFRRIDELVRRNPGKLLTVIDFGIYAGRLGVGGVSLDGKEQVIIPQASGTKAYGMHLSGDIKDLYELDRVCILPSSVHSIFGSGKAKIFESWSALLDISKVVDVGKATLVVGDLVEGEPTIPSGKDAEFWQTVFDRVKRVGNAATAQLVS